MRSLYLDHTAVFAFNKHTEHVFHMRLCLYFIEAIDITKKRQTGVKTYTNIHESI